MTTSMQAMNELQLSVDALQKRTRIAERISTEVVDATASPTADLVDWMARFNTMKKKLQKSIGLAKEYQVKFLEAEKAKYEVRNLLLAQTYVFLISKPFFRSSTDGCFLVKVISGFSPLQNYWRQK